MTLREHFISEKKDAYPRSEERMQQEKIMYNQTFRKALEEEQAKKIREQKKVKMAINAYSKNMVLQDRNEIINSSITEESQKQEKRNSLFVRIKELFLGVDSVIKQEEKKVKSHYEFMRELKPKYINESNDKNTTREHKRELEK